MRKRQTNQVKYLGKMENVPKRKLWKLRPLLLVRNLRLHDVHGLLTETGIKRQECPKVHATVIPLNLYWGCPDPIK